MTIRTVMLVDDEPDIRQIGELSLRHRGGWNVQLAGSGAEALELAAREPPDVILLDMMMPDMDGAATLSLLRAQPKSASIPVVFITASTQPADVERYRTLGAAGVIAKPFDPLTLADELRRIVGG